MSALMHECAHVWYMDDKCPWCVIELLRGLLAEALEASDEHPDGPMLRSTTAAAIREILGGPK